jgi:hypothetical protein
MGKFLNGVFVGVGIGLFIAPQTGEETRRMIMERAVALHKKLLSEDQQHVSIDARSLQMPSFPAEPAQPATEFVSEAQVQETPSVAVTQPETAISSEPEEQETPSIPPTQPLMSGPQMQGAANVPLAQPATEFFCVPQLYEPPAVSEAQAATEFTSESQVHNIASHTSDGITPRFSNQNANMTGNPGSSAGTSETMSPADTGFVSDEKIKEQNPAETPRTDTAITDKLSPLSTPSSMPGRTVRRKTSTRTPSTGKSKGHSRS